jgi:predicted amidophosphoribosyltransferase
VIKLGLCKCCGLPYDMAETDDQFCPDCPGEYDQEMQEIVKAMRNIQDLDAE